MTNLMRIRLAQSEARERANALQAKTEKTDAEKAEIRELGQKLVELETEYRTALLAEPEVAETTRTDDAETREIREIRSRTGIADYLGAAVGNANPEGAAAEFLAAHKLQLRGPKGGINLPLAIFPETRQRQQPEARAVTDAPAGIQVQMPEPYVPYVFERSAAAALGIQFPSAGPGSVQIPRVTTAPPADTLAQSGAAPSTAAVVGLATRTPKRIAGQFELQVEDLAVYPQLEEVLAQTIRGSLGNELDEQAFNGTGGAGDLTGLFQTAANVAADADALTYSAGVSKFAALVDGRHAYDLMDIGCIIGASTYARMMAQFQGDGDMPVYDYLRSKLRSLRVSERVPAAAGDAQKGIVCLHASGDPVRIYVWNALEMIRDPYSGAGKGEVTVTATALVSDIFIPHTTDQVKEIHPKLA